MKTEFFNNEFQAQLDTAMDFEVSMSELEAKEEGMVLKNFGGRMLPTLEELTLQ